jgi:hypothetical protein
MLARTGLAYAAANRSDFDSGWDPREASTTPAATCCLPSRRRCSTATTGTASSGDMARCIRGHPLGSRGDPRLGDKFLVTTQQRGRGSGSGVAVSEPVFQLFTLRGGLVVGQEDFLDRSKALEAAGPRE